ncbi:MAG: hypothetical protein JNJ60_20815 [Rhodocyclaceae bacterium]|nr:hypothetical protein [Rhodocyclaceae bacterium]
MGFAAQRMLERTTKSPEKKPAENRSQCEVFVPQNDEACFGARMHLAITSFRHQLPPWESYKHQASKPNDLSMIKSSQRAFSSIGTLLHNEPDRFGKMGSWAARVYAKYRQISGEQDDFIQCDSITR